MRFRKYSGILRVILPENRLARGSSLFASDPDVHGYYRNVSVYAPSESQAVKVVSDNTVDGDIDWSQSDLSEVKKNALDWFRILLGFRVLHDSGRAFFPLDEIKDDQNDIIGWRTLRKKHGSGGSH
jgi:hypothetical protein